MELRILGTGSATPVLEHFPSAQVLFVEHDSFLIDCGEGTQYRILEQKIRATRIRHIFISHLHGDHYFGLIGLLSSWNLNQRKEDLTIFAPRGLAEILTIQFKHSDTWLRFKINFVELDTTKEQIILDTPTISVETIPLQHRVACCGFLFRKKCSDRKILKEKLPENFPIPYIKLLKSGHDLTDELTGKIYRYEEYTIPSKQAKSYAYCSDTMYNELKIKQLQNIDVLYHEATFQEEQLKRATETNHSTAKQAAQIAQKANVGTLIIGHYSSRYKDLSALLSEAKSVFPNTFLAEEGKSFEI